MAVIIKVTIFGKVIEGISVHYKASTGHHAAKRTDFSGVVKFRPLKEGDVVNLTIIWGQITRLLTNYQLTSGVNEINL